MSQLKSLHDYELIAVISAAINSITGKKGNKFVIKSFRRVGQNAPAWNMAGKFDRLKII